LDHFSKPIARPNAFSASVSGRIGGFCGGVGRGGSHCLMQRVFELALTHPGTTFNAHAFARL
jgi:hypothetical protein